MNIYALDVETANTEYESICQIGIAKIQDDIITDEACWIINPEGYFDQFNVDIHGITEEMVAGAPTLPQVYENLKGIIESSVVIHHMPFDRVAMRSAFEKYDLTWIDSEWLDSARIVRRTWAEFAQRGYGLANVSEYLGIEFDHHNALEDAKTAAIIVVEASWILDMSISEMVLFAKKKNIFNYDFDNLDVNEEGPLFGNSLTFTGSLAIPRKKAAEIAATAGCKVEKNVTMQTDILVVVIQDADRLKGYEKSRKHRRAEELIQSGQEIRIITEKDFYRLVADWMPKGIVLERQERKKPDASSRGATTAVFSFEDVLKSIENSGLLNKKTHE